MESGKWERIKDIFAAAAPLPVAQREALLDNACAGDREIRREVERLLAHNPEVALIDNAPFQNKGLLQRSLSESSLQDGELLAGRFRIQRWIGAGGMGEVYEALDTRLEETVAIKTIRHDTSADTNALARFRREISLARQVTHPSVCRVYDLFTSPRKGGGSIDFLTMEYVDGETLTARLKREGPMSLADALPVIEQVASALDVAHRSRVMHRDLKSSNIMISKGTDGQTRAVVTDFGLARSTSGGDTIVTGSGYTAGTPAYMAPEQLEGCQLTPASDMYALGVVMYEMATRTTPHASDSPLQVAARRMKEAPVPPGKLAAVDPVWEAAILKCLAHSPEQRFASGAELIQALRSASPVKLPRAPLAMPKWAALAAIALLLFAAIGWYAVDSLPAKAVSVQAARYYQQGVEALADGAPHKASQVLELALQAEPSFAAARCRLAEAYQELDQRDKAREELMKALDGTARARHERLLRDATKAYLVGDWNKAAEALQARIHRVDESDRTTAMLDLARLYDRAGKPKEAMDAYKAVIARDPSQPGARVALARLLDGDSKRKDALPILAEAERLYQVMQNSEGLGNALLARSFMEDNADTSIALAKRAEETATRVGSTALTIKAKLRQAQRLDYQGKGDEATAVANEAVTLAEEKGLGALAALGFIDLGMTPFSQRKYREAEAYFQRAIQLAQRHGAKRTEALAKLNMGYCLSFQSDAVKIKEGLALLSEARDFFLSTGEKPLATRALRHHADGLRTKGDLDGARKELEQVEAESETESDKMAARTYLARFLHSQGHYEEAARLFDQCASYYEKRKEAQNAQNFRVWYARSLNGGGKADQAAAVLAQIEKEGPANDAVKQVIDQDLATLDFDRERYSEAFARMSRMLAEMERKGQKGLVQNHQYTLCLRYAMAGYSAQAATTCKPLLKVFDGQLSRLTSIHQSLCLAHLSRNPAEAVKHCREAGALSGRMASRQEIFYSALLLTKALHVAKDRTWTESRQNTYASIASWEQAAGKPTVDGYLRRPRVARKMQELKSLQ